MSTNTEKSIRRYQRAINRHVTVLLAQLVIVAERNFCHRDEDYLKPERLESITTSVVQEGLSNSIVVYETGEKKTIEGKSLPVYGIVSGHRRYNAINRAIDDHLSPEYHANMEVPVVVMSRGEGQSAEEFDHDVLTRSVMENTQFSPLGALDRLSIVEEFESRKLPKPRAASALAISVTQYERDARLVRNRTFLTAVRKRQIGQTDAANLLEAAEKENRVDQLVNEFTLWVREKELELEHEKSQLKNLGKELSGSGLDLKKYLNPGVLKLWQSAIKEGKSFREVTPQFFFGVVVDPLKKMLDSPRLSLNLNEAGSGQIETVIAAYLSAARQLVVHKKAAEAREQMTDLTDEQIEAEIARVQQAGAEAAKRRADAEAGRDPVIAPDAPTAETEDVGAAVQHSLAQLRQQTDGVSGEPDADDLDVANA